MRDITPYRTTNSNALADRGGAKSRSRPRAALLGFAIGAVLPVGYGMYAMYHESVYYASLPQGDDFARCGMGSLAAFMMIFFVGPICGAIGPAAGFAASAIDWSSSRPSTYEAPEQSIRPK